MSEPRLAAQRPAFSHFPKTWVAVATATLFAVLVPNSMLFRAGDPDDSSVFAYIGWLMTRGYVPYRDVWDHKGPILYYLNWFGWTLMPSSTAGIGALQVLFYAVAFWLVFRILQQARVGQGSALCTGLFSISALAQLSHGGNMAETWALTAIALAHWIAFLGLRTRIRHWHFACLGLALGFCFWIRPNLCLLPALAILTVAHVQRVRRSFLAGFAGLLLAAAAMTLVSAFALWPILRSGALEAFRDAYFTYNASYSQFTNLHDHLVGAWQLLLVPKTMALALLAFLGWMTLWRSRLHIPTAYRVLLLSSFPLEFFAAALSGRPYFHYLAALWPTAFVLAGTGAHELAGLLWRPRRKVGLVLLLLAALGLEARRYALFAWKADHLNRQEAAMAAYIDAQASATERILPIGDVSSVAVALRSRREPAGRFVYQLAMVHKANRRAEQQQAEELAAVGAYHPKIVFSLPGMVGNLCGSVDAFGAEASREGYAYGRMRTLLAPLLEADYRRIESLAFQDGCVYERVR